MKWRQSVEIEASGEKVWRLVAERFGEIATWAGPVHQSAMKDECVRVCVTSMGTVEERIVDIDPLKRILTYEAVVRPPWMRRGTNRMQVVELGADRCRVDADAVVEVEPTQAWRLLSALPDLSRLARVLDDLKVFAENGRPSERKRSAPTHHHPATFGLWANVAFSAATGAVLALDVGDISAVVLVHETASRMVGVGLVLFAGFVAWTALHVRTRIVLAISVADLGWVIGSAVAIAMEPTRLLWVGGAADVVLAIAALQLWGVVAARNRGWREPTTIR